MTCLSASDSCATFLSLDGKSMHRRGLQAVRRLPAGNHSQRSAHFCRADPSFPTRHRLTASGLKQKCDGLCGIFTLSVASRARHPPFAQEPSVSSRFCDSMCRAAARRNGACFGRLGEKSVQKSRQLWLRGAPIARCSCERRRHPRWACLVFGGRGLSALSLAFVVFFWEPQKCAK